MKAGWELYRISEAEEGVEVYHWALKEQKRAFVGRHARDGAAGSESAGFSGLRDGDGAGEE